ncbi:sensor domain-containing protein [Mycobacterium sp. NPDC003449]
MAPDRPPVPSILAVLVATSVLAAGCAQDTGGTATPANGAEAPIEAGVSDKQTPPTATGTADEYAWMSSVMPSAGELSTALGHETGAGSSRPFVGDSSDLRDTFTGSRAIVEDQCIGIVSPFEKQAYGSAPVRAVTYDSGSTSNFGVVALATTSDAESLFATFQKRWRECDGITLTKADSTYTYTHQITDVAETDNVISAVDTVTSNSPTGVPVRTARALGLADDCIVETEVTLTDSLSPDTRPHDAAVALVRLMSTKIVSAHR